MATETRGELESSRARHAQGHSRYRRQSEQLYERLRKLENAVRNHAHDHVCGVDGHCAELLRLVPRHPRPTVTELKKGVRTHGGKAPR